MSTSFIIPSDYHYVVTSLSLLAIVVWSQAYLVLKYRRRANIVYPQMYADQGQVEASEVAYLYNCAQRIHQNTLEALATLVPSIAIIGLEFPRFAAGACVVWTITRIPYTIGYMSGDPKNRVRIGGILGIYGNFLLSFIAIFVAGKRLYDAHF